MAPVIVLKGHVPRRSMWLTNWIEYIQVTLLSSWMSLPSSQYWDDHSADVLHQCMYEFWHIVQSLDVLLAPLYRVLVSIQESSSPSVLLFFHGQQETLQHTRVISGNCLKIYTNLLSSCGHLNNLHKMWTMTWPNYFWSGPWPDLIIQAFTAPLLPVSLLQIPLRYYYIIIQ